MPIQWETLLQSNAVFHWLRGNLESALISQSCSKNGFCSRKCAAAENTNAIKRCNSDTFVYPRLCLYLCICLCRLLCLSVAVCLLSVVCLSVCIPLSIYTYTLRWRALKAPTSEHLISAVTWSRSRFNTSGPDPLWFDWEDLAASQGTVAGHSGHPPIK